MRILLITDGFPSESEQLFERQRYELANRIALMGHSVLVISPGRVKIPTASIFEGVEVILIPASYVVNKLGVYYPIPDLSALFKVTRTVGRDFGIHHYYKQEYLTSLPSILKTQAVKVLTVDNFPGLDYHHGRTLIDFVTRIQSLTIVRVLLSTFDGIITLSKRSLKTAVKLGVKKNKIRWIPHGIDVKKIKPNSKIREKTREKMGLNGPCFLFIGRLSPVKGLNYLVKAIHNLDRKGLKGNLLIVGMGPEVKKLQLLKKFRNIRTCYLGYKENPIDYIQASDFLVLPSTGEGCPNVVLEALACGKPVIGSKVGGIPDLVIHTKNGILVDAGNSIQLAEAIETLISDPDQVGIMGENAREFAEKNLDWKTIIKQVTSFYKTIMLD